MILPSLDKATGIFTWQSSLFLLLIQRCLKQFVNLAADMLFTEHWEFVFISLPASLLHKPKRKKKKEKKET